MPSVLGPAGDGAKPPARRRPRAHHAVMSAAKPSGSRNFSKHRAQPRTQRYLGTFTGRGVKTKRKSFTLPVSVRIPGHECRAASSPSRNGAGPVREHAVLQRLSTMLRSTPSHPSTLEPSFGSTKPPPLMMQSADCTATGQGRHGGFIVFAARKKMIKRGKEGLGI